MEQKQKQTNTDTMEMPRGNVSCLVEIGKFEYLLSVTYIERSIEQKKDVVQVSILSLRKRLRVTSAYARPDWSVEPEPDNHSTAQHNTTEAQIRTRWGRMGRDETRREPRAPT